MRRISKIRSAREADLEERRERLRNMRWTRHRNQLFTMAGLLSAATLSGTGVLGEALRLLTSL